MLAAYRWYAGEFNWYTIGTSITETTTADAGWEGDLSSGIRAEQKERTRLTLIREGRRLFATHGYNAVGLLEICRFAGVTKGALYHQFDGKAALFRVIVEEVQQEVAEAIDVAAAALPDEWTRLIQGCEVFLTVSTDPSIQRILMIDGPAVLGWEEWRALDEGASAGQLALVLTALMEQGTIATQPVAPLTHLLNGAINEAALWLARSNNPDDLIHIKAALSTLLRGLRDDADSR